MIPPNLFLVLQQQRQWEVLRQADRARLVRARRRKPASDEWVFQHLLCWVGGPLLCWGRTLQHAGRATGTAEKGCSVCP
jgi:hypothetical protein